MSPSVLSSVKALLAALLFCVSAALSAQSIQVSDFHLDEMDTDANKAGTSFIDPNNGNLCALIKVHTTQKGFTFDVGALGVAKTEPQGGAHPTQIWVYVPQGVKRISIYHPQLGELEDYDLGMTLRSARTYHLTIQTGSVQTLVNPSLQKQFAIFTLVPANASFEVDGEAWEVNAQGQAARQLPFGTYQYRATAPRYKTSVGQFTVGKEKHTETIRLIPNISTITFQAPAAAEVWVDGERRGSGTFSIELTSGQYQVECRQESHLSTTKVVTVEANQPQTIILDAPRSMYGILSVSSSPFGAKVSVDGKDVGETPLSLDNVLVGQRLVAVTLDGYVTPEAKTVTVSQEQAAEVAFELKKNVTLEAKTVTVSQEQATERDLEQLKEDEEPLRELPQDDAQDIAPAAVELPRSDSTPESALTFTVNDVSFKMVKVDGGTFMMGATSEQGSDAFSGEKPVHEVTLSAFSIGETEVTQELWQAVMGSNPSKFRGDKHPVENVSWEDCQQFIEKLNGLTGKDFRLPTESEWEYAARGGNQSKGFKYSGGNDLGDVAWYAENSRSSTQEVASKTTNELGLYDMCGNVWEWCQDWYGDYEAGSQTNPKGPTSVLST